MSNGNEMWRLAERLFPICRSITGDGVRETLGILSETMPMSIHEVPTGTQVFDWEVPKEWNIQDAFIADSSGKRIVDFRQSNLHVVGYSTPVDKIMTLAELEPHLYSLPDQPDAIPYMTSYYRERWGFCMRHDERCMLSEDRYHVVINSELKHGSLTYGEIIIPGESDKEVFISTYVCHPSMANNELSGPVITINIAQWLASTSRKYTYRIVFIPETIGSITYLSRNLESLRSKVVAGFNISCIGDEGPYSRVASRYDNTLADKVAEHVLKHMDGDRRSYSFLERGSDERQYCSPHVDLPLTGLSRSKYSTYPEYHTSLDNLDFVTPAGLQGGYDYLHECLELLENNRTYNVLCSCEPQLGKRGLYPNLSTKDTSRIVATMMDFIAYADGTNSLVEICDIIDKPWRDVASIARKLNEAGLVEDVSQA